MRPAPDSLIIVENFNVERNLLRLSDFSLSRRRLLRQLGLVGLATSLPLKQMFASEKSSVSPPSGNAAKPVIRNRAPLSPGAFCALPAGSIRPTGWLRNQLQIQASGLSGHLDETWADVGPDSGWLGGKGESWERGPYYLDGLVPLAWMLDDERLKAKAQRFLDWTLNHQAPNGLIGPPSNDDWWPRFVMLKALTQYHELTGDPRVIPVMDRYFRYQLAALPTRHLRDWGKFRWQDEALSVIWLYNRTGSAYLLDLARMLHQQGYDWQSQFSDFKYTKKITPDFIKLDEDRGLRDISLATHGVNNGQAIKAGPVWSLVSGNRDDCTAVFKMIAELDKYHGLPNGMFSCDEHLAGPDPSQGSELCTVVEYMFSLEHALAISGDSSLGDRLEQLAFNALPGTFTDDMWAHQYNQEPNQVECSLHRKPWTTDGPESNLYGLEPNFGCCTANYHQGWPKFANSLFILSGSQDSDANDGLVAAVYAPCEVQTLIRKTAVRVIEETGYPFNGTITLAIHPSTPVQFPLQLRIPAWAEGAALRVNGQVQPPPAAGTFARVERTWRAGDRVELEFPMRARVSRGFNESVSVERGPILFSYRYGRDLGQTRRPRHDRRLAGVSINSVELRPQSRYGRSFKINQGERDRSGGKRVQQPACAGAPHGEGSQTPGMARRRRRCQSRPAKPCEDRRARRRNFAHPLRSCETADHILPAPAEPGRLVEGQESDDPVPVAPLSVLGAGARTAKTRRLNSTGPAAGMPHLTRSYRLEAINRLCDTGLALEGPAGRIDLLVLNRLQRSLGDLLIGYERQAGMAELADAADSKSVGGNSMGVQLPLPAPLYISPKALIIKGVTATAINPQSVIPAVNPILEGTEMGTERIPFSFNCLNGFRQLYSAEPYAWLTLYMPNYGMRSG